MTPGRITIVNETGLTIHTSALADFPSVALGPGRTSLPRDAWEHTLTCSPGLRRLVDLSVEEPAEDSAEFASVAPAIEAVSPEHSAEEIESPKVSAPSKATYQKRRR